MPLPSLPFSMRTRALTWFCCSTQLAWFHRPRFSDSFLRRRITQRGVACRRCAGGGPLVRCSWTKTPFRPLETDVNSLRQLHPLPPTVPPPRAPAEMLPPQPPRAHLARRRAGSTAGQPTSPILPMKRPPASGEDRSRALCCAHGPSAAITPGTDETFAVCSFFVRSGNCPRMLIVAQMLREVRADAHDGWHAIGCDDL